MANVCTIVDGLVKDYERLIANLESELKTMRTDLETLREKISSIHTTYSTYASPEALGPVIELFETKKSENMEDYTTIFLTYDTVILDIEAKYKEAARKLDSLYDYQIRERNEDKVFKSWELAL